MLQEGLSVCWEIREREITETRTPKITEQLALQNTLVVHMGFGAGQGMKDKSTPDPGKPQEQKPRNETVWVLQMVNSPRIGPGSLKGWQCPSMRSVERSGRFGLAGVGGTRRE